MLYMKEKTCCFTGHRKIPSDDILVITQKLKETLVYYIGKGYRYFGTDGALGFDTLAAQTILKLKHIYPHIKLILVLPCIEQTKGWRLTDIQEYQRIKSQADKVVYTSHKYYNGCMFKRNRYLVDKSSLCICYMTRDGGGTAYTVNYAQNAGLMVINFA